MKAASHQQQDAKTMCKGHDSSASLWHPNCIKEQSLEADLRQ